MTGLMTIVPISEILPIGSEKAAGVKDSGFGTSVPFADVLKDAVQNLEEARKLSEQDSYDLVTGSVSDLHNVMIHSAMEATALETTVQLTSRAVSAYREIMQMQI